jgi:hypothetical protein
MTPLSPITFAFIGLFIGLWIEGMLFLGAYPEDEGGAPVAPTLAYGGFLLSGLTMLFGSLWLILSSRVEEALGLNQVFLLLTGIMGMYGAILTVAGIAQRNGWDLRPVGQMALAGFILQLFMTPAIIGALGGFAAVPGVAVSLIIYMVLLLSFFLLTNGRLGLRPVGVMCILSALASLWVALGFTGAVGYL